MVPSIILHELAHGVVALAFGDDTARRAGRLSLNPVRHVDPVGSLLLPAIFVIAGYGYFGWAKPVPVNPARMRSPRNQWLLVALAGPATNLVLAALAAVAFRATGAAQAPGFPVWAQALFYFGLLNVWLALFNLLPIPPLDGSAVVERLLPRTWWPGYLRLRQQALPALVLVFVALSWSHWNPLGSAFAHVELWWLHVVT
jgi:Zn-dependent protease